MEVILYGAGSDLSRILKILKNTQYEPVYIADGNGDKTGQTICGLPVIAPETIMQYNITTIIITASFFDDIYQTISSVLGAEIENYSILAAPYVWLMLVNVEYNKGLLEEAGSYIRKHRDEIISIFDLSDAYTSRLLSFLLSARIKGEYTFFNYAQIQGFQYTEGYFYQNELSDLGEFTFVDCGAYTGDTFMQIFRSYGRQIRRYYAYEPSDKNFNLLCRNVNSSKNADRCTCRKYAAGKAAEQIYMGKEGGDFGIIGRYQDQDCLELVNVVPLDEEDIKVQGMLVIKMDVEGAETDILEGAREMIKRYRPWMAVCVYHRYSDIHRLPEFIRDMGLNYKFVLRSGIHTHMLAIPI